MKIFNYLNTPSFKARIVAEATTPKSEFQILELDKTDDAEALRKLNESFTRDNILKRFPDNGLLSVSLAFINFAFDSINRPYAKAYMTLCDGKPSGLMTIEPYDKHKTMSLNYLAAWKPDGMQKPHNNGKVLIRYLLEQALRRQDKTIELSPGFKSDDFYEKLGFKVDDFYATLCNEDIAKCAANIDKSVKFKMLDNPQKIDLVV